MCLFSLIAPLKGHLIVDVDDKAYATIHLGILGLQLDFFRAELCFKGNIRYEINILKVREHTINVLVTSVKRFQLY